MPDQRTGFQPPPVNSPSPLEGETASLVTRGGSTDAHLLEVSIRVARQYPRDEKQIMEKLRATLDAYPQFAEKALYSYPVEDRRRGRTVYIEGLTIRAAETLAAAWGNLRSGVRKVDEDEQGVDLEAVVFDMENNRWELTPGRALKTMKTKEGRLVLLDERGFLQAVGSAASKTKRNAILSVLPLHLKAFFESEVRRHVAGGELNQAASSERVTRALQRFEKEYRVSQAQLEEWVGKPTSMWIGSDIAELQALFNGLEQGETTIMEAFGGDVPATAPATPSAPIVVDARNAQLKESAPAPPVAAVAPTPPPPAPVAIKPDSRIPVKDVYPDPKPKPKPPNGRKARATPYVEPTQVDMPPPTPIAPPAPSAAPTDPAGATPDLTLRLRLSAEIAAASTPAECDAMLGRIYRDAAVPKDVKRDALDWATARRDELQAREQ